MKEMSVGGILKGSVCTMHTSMMEQYLSWNICLVSWQETGNRDIIRYTSKTNRGVYTITPPQKILTPTSIYKNTKNIRKNNPHPITIHVQRWPFLSKRNWATNSDFLIPISLQPDVVNLWYFKVLVLLDKKV